MSQIVTTLTRQKRTMSSMDGPYGRDFDNEPIIENENVCIIDRLFKEHVGVTGGKRFSKNHVKVTITKSVEGYIKNYGYGKLNPSLTINYNYDGVKIYYYKRVDCYLGDTDMFLDIRVTVDNDIIFNKRYLQC